MTDLEDIFEAADEAEELWQAYAASNNAYERKEISNDMSMEVLIFVPALIKAAKIIKAYDETTKIPRN